MQLSEDDESSPQSASVIAEAQSPPVVESCTAINVPSSAISSPTAPPLTISLQSTVNQEDRPKKSRFKVKTVENEVGF